MSLSKAIGVSRTGHGFAENGSSIQENYTIDKDSLQRKSLCESAAGKPATSFAPVTFHAAEPRNSVV